MFAIDENASGNNVDVFHAPGGSTHPSEERDRLDKTQLNIASQSITNHSQ